MPNQPSLLSDLKQPGVQRRALLTSLLIGTLLILINHGPTLWQGQLPPLWQLLLTYLVPWGVSAWSSIAALRDNTRPRV